MNEDESCLNSPQIKCPYRDDEFVELIAEKAKTKVIDDLTEDAYLYVGKLVISKLIYLIGLIGGGVYIWLVSNGYIPSAK